MPQSGFSSAASKVFELPRCPRCGAVMMLSRIDPSGPGLDERTFECEHGHTETVLVPYKITGSAERQLRR